MIPRVVGLVEFIVFKRFDVRLRSEAFAAGKAETNAVLEVDHVIIATFRRLGCLRWVVIPIIHDSDFLMFSTHSAIRGLSLRIYHFLP